MQKILKMSALHWILLCFCHFRKEREIKDVKKSSFKEAADKIRELIYVPEKKIHDKIHQVKSLH